MRLRGWHVDGFGIHRDWRLDDLSPGLTVFHGPNESGKSTLLAFLRGVLFGFPDGRSREPRYPPVGGGAHGGRITLESDRGAVVVERFAGPGKSLSITLEDGSPGAPADLAERLGRADARLFRSVYAFGLGELQELGSLGEAGVQDHLFSAGVTGAGRSARHAGRVLDEAAKELFAGVRGRKRDRARPLAEEIRQVAAELAERQQAAAGHSAVRDRERALASRLEVLEAEAEAERAAERQGRRLVELWNEVWSPLAGLREEASKLRTSGGETLPADAGERLSDVRATMRRERERLDDVASERAALAERMAELRPDPAARAVAARVSALHDQLALQRSQSQRLSEIRELQRGARDRLDAILERLGLPEVRGEAELPNAGDDEVDRELRGWKLRLEASKDRVREEDATARVAREQRDRARARLDAAAAAGSERPGPAELARLLAVVCAAAAAGYWLTGGLEGLAAGAVGAGASWLVARRRRDRVESARADARTQLDLAEARAVSTDASRRRSAEELEAALEGFGAWKRARRIPEPLSPGEVAELLQDAGRARDALAEVARLDAERRGLAAAVDEWSRAVDGLLLECSPEIEAPGRDDPARFAALASLRERCESERKARQEREALGRQDEPLRARAAVHEGALAAAQAVLAALLEEAGVRDAAALERRLEEQARARDLTGRIAAKEEELGRRLEAAGPEQAPRLRAQLATGRVSEWENGVRRAREQVARIRDLRDEALRSHQDLARTRQRLEESTDVADLELRRSALEQELREVLDEWRQLRLASRLIERTLARFEARHQPGVLQEASRLFDVVTGGRYPRIVQSDDEPAGFSVMTRDGTHRSPRDLSRGTAEQLYLCVRLGLVAELSRTRVPLPVVMDDVLVNFDDERAAAMAGVLGRFAADHQLLFFTCNDRTRRLLERGCPDARVRSLEATR